MKAGYLLLAAMFLTTTAHAAQEADPRGVWMREDGNARVRIAPCGDAMCATNLWIKDTSKGEEVGDKLIMTLKPESPTTLAGEAYDPKRGKSYAIKVIVGDDSLTTRGCIVAGMLCKNVSWTPAK